MLFVYHLVWPKFAFRGGAGCEGTGCKMPAGGSQYSKVGK